MFADLKPSPAALVCKFSKTIIKESQHPYGMSSFFYGLSHGLKIARSRSIFAPVCALVPPFRVPSRAKHEIKEEIPFGISSFIWYTGRDSNPQPSEPDSDALSIEPPVRAWQLCYYSNLLRVCKDQK